jgi:hypothetical protein
LPRWSRARAADRSGAAGRDAEGRGGAIGRTHANLLHHFGSASGLQKALAAHLASAICGTIAEAVIATRSGVGSPREVVDLTFDAFDKEGAGALASWMLLSGNEDALDPIVDAIHDRHGTGRLRIRRDAQIDAHAGADGAGRRADGRAAFRRALGLPRTAARDHAEAMLVEAAERAGIVQQQG